MWFFLGSKELNEHLKESTPILLTPEPLADDTNEDARKKLATAYQEFKDWKKADVEVRHYLALTLPDSLLIKAVKCKTAATLWSTLCSEHEAKSKSFKMEMTQRLHNTHCTNSDDVATHLTGMEQLREELSSTGETIEDTDFALILTNWLPKPYGNINSTAYTTAEMNGKVLSGPLYPTALSV